MIEIVAIVEPYALDSFLCILLAFVLVQFPNVLSYLCIRFKGSKLLKAKMDEAENPELKDTVQIQDRVARIGEFRELLQRIDLCHKKLQSSVPAYVSSILMARYTGIHHSTVDVFASLVLFLRIFQAITIMNLTAQTTEHFRHLLQVVIVLLQGVLMLMAIQASIHSKE